MQNLRQTPQTSNRSGKVHELINNALRNRLSEPPRIETSENVDLSNIKIFTPQSSYLQTAKESKKPALVDGFFEKQNAIHSPITPKRNKLYELKKNIENRLSEQRREGMENRKHVFNADNEFMDENNENSEDEEEFEDEEDEEEFEDDEDTIIVDDREQITETQIDEISDQEIKEFEIENERIDGEDAVVEEMEAQISEPFYEPMEHEDEEEDNDDNESGYVATEVGQSVEIAPNVLVTSVKKIETTKKPLIDDYSSDESSESDAKTEGEENDEELNFTSQDVVGRDNLIDDEAELSGDENYDDQDDNEDQEDNEYEPEAGDHDFLPDDEELRSSLIKTHIKLQNIDEERRLNKLKEQFEGVLDPSNNWDRSFRSRLQEAAFNFADLTSGDPLDCDEQPQEDLEDVEFTFEQYLKKKENEEIQAAQVQVFSLAAAAENVSEDLTDANVTTSKSATNGPNPNSVAKFIVENYPMESFI